AGRQTKNWSRNPRRRALARMRAARRAASALQDHAAGPRNGGAEARIDRVCEINVHSQVRTVRDSPIVRSAWNPQAGTCCSRLDLSTDGRPLAGSEMQLHGAVFRGALIAGIRTQGGIAAYIRLEAIIYSANDAIDIEGHKARGGNHSGPRGKSWDRNGGENDDLRQKTQGVVFDKTRPMLFERVF